MKKVEAKNIIVLGILLLIITQKLLAQHFEVGGTIGTLK
jgi:hypothetical protein